MVLEKEGENEMNIILEITKEEFKSMLETEYCGQIPNISNMEIDGTFAPLTKEEPYITVKLVPIQ